MSNILNSFIPKYLIDLNRNSEDIITVSTKYFSPNGDIYELDKRTVAPVMVQTTQSLEELRPEVSDVYPFKIVTPLDFDGSTLILTPSIETQPTASQGYYVPIYFERFNPTILNAIDRSFNELTVPTSSIFS